MVVSKQQLTREAMQETARQRILLNPNSAMNISSSSLYYRGDGNYCQRVAVVLNEQLGTLERPKRLAFLAWLMGRRTLDSMKSLMVAEMEAVLEYESDLKGLYDEFVSTVR